jgi:hypothetical protein
MTVYVIVQLKMTDRAAYDRYLARFFDVFSKFERRLLSADEHPSVLEGGWDRDSRRRGNYPAGEGILAVSLALGDPSNTKKKGSTMREPVSIDSQR